jgi:hypothetical protein
VLPPIRGDVFDCRGADLCPDLATRCHVNRIKSPQADAGAMTTNQCACLNKDIGCYLNDLHAIENGIERLLSGGKPARSRSVLERESSLTFDR